MTRTDLEKYHKPDWGEFAAPCYKLNDFSVVTVPTERGLKVITPAAPYQLYFHHVPKLEYLAPDSVLSLLEQPELMGRITENSWCFGTEHESDKVLTLQELAEVLSEINDLAFQSEADDYGLLRPSFGAHKACIKLILELAQAGELVRPSDIGSDRNGDIRISWAADDRETELVFPSEEHLAPYVYYSSPASYGTDTDVSIDALSKRISWALRGL